MHGPEHVDLKVVEVDEVESREGLIDRLKSAESRLTADGIKHISINPVPGQPTMYGLISEFIESV
jgi:hypothetical protein